MGNVDELELFSSQADSVPNQQSIARPRKKKTSPNGLSMPKAVRVVDDHEHLPLGQRLLQRATVVMLPKAYFHKSLPNGQILKVPMYLGRTQTLSLIALEMMTALAHKIRLSLKMVKMATLLIPNRTAMRMTTVGTAMKAELLAFSPQKRTK